MECEREKLATRCLTFMRYKSFVLRYFPLFLIQKTQII